MYWKRKKRKKEKLGNLRGRKGKPIVFTTTQTAESGFTGDLGYVSASLDRIRICKETLDHRKLLSRRVFVQAFRTYRNKKSEASNREDLTLSCDSRIKHCICKYKNNNNTTGHSSQDFRSGNRIPRGKRFLAGLEHLRYR